MPRDYHAKIGFPDIEFPTGKIALEPTSHARRRSDEHKFGSFTLPGFLELDSEMYQRDPERAVGYPTEPHVFEITVEDMDVVKLAARWEYNEEMDISVVAEPRDGTLITAWRNNKDDCHDTLDESEYAEPAYRLHP